MKNQSSHDLVSEYGAQRAVLRPRCIGTEGAQTHILLSSSSDCTAGLTADERKFDSLQGRIICFSLKLSNPLCGPPSLLFFGYRGILRHSKEAVMWSSISRYAVIS